jgi:urocanate hydratase
LERVLTFDPAMGVFRHAEAGYDTARQIADDRMMSNTVLPTQPRFYPRYK